jgi:hypothetical protein
MLQKKRNSTSIIGKWCFWVQNGLRLERDYKKDHYNGRIYLIRKKGKGVSFTKKKSWTSEEQFDNLVNLFRYKEKEKFNYFKKKLWIYIKIRGTKEVTRRSSYN